MKDIINRLLDDPMEFMLAAMFIIPLIMIFGSMFEESTQDKKARIFKECIELKQVSEDVCMEVAKIERRDNN